MSKTNRTPLERTDISAESLRSIADAFNDEIISEMRRLADKMKSRGIASVAVTGAKTVEKARTLLIGWVTATEKTINMAKRSLDDLAKQNAAQIAEQAMEKDAKRKSRK